MVGLDAVDRRLLSALVKEPLASSARLGRMAELSARTAARRVKRLLEDGAVSVRARPAPAAINERTWLFRADVAPGTALASARALAQLGGSRWVRLTSTMDRLVAGYTARTPYPEGLMRALPSVPGLARPEVHEVIQEWRDGVALAQAAGHQLDELDSRLLGALMADGRLDATGLGRALGIDPTTAARRRQRLIDAGAILFEADVDSRFLGAPLDVLLWLSVPPGRIREVAARLSAHPDIRFVAFVAAPHSLVANAHLPDRASVLDLVDDPVVMEGVTDLELGFGAGLIKRHRS